MLRALLFCVCAGFILLAPLSDPLGKRRPYLPRWTMFAGMALGHYEVRFTSQEPGGSPRAVDRYAALGYPDRRKAPDFVRRIRSVRDAQRLAQKLCARLPEGTRLSMRLRKASRRGWSVLDDGSTDACETDAERGSP